MRRSTLQETAVVRDPYARWCERGGPRGNPLLDLRASGLTQLLISFPMHGERLNVLKLLDGEASNKADCISLSAPNGLELAP
jgi:hypothetical protein